MRPIQLIAMLSIFVSLSACADESAAPTDVQAATSVSRYHEINGVRLKLASEGTAGYVNHTEVSSTFRDAAQKIGVVFELSTKEVLRLNGWEKVADEVVPLKVAFWMDPSLHPSNLDK